MRALSKAQSTMWLLLLLCAVTSSTSGPPEPCPSLQAVKAEALALGMQPASLEDLELDREPVPEGLRIRLVGPRGVEVERVLPEGVDCGGLARTVAVLVVSSRSERAEVTLSEPPPPLAWEVGAAVKGPFGAPSAAWGASGSFWLRPAGGWLGLRAQLGYELPREFLLGPGRVSVPRGTLGAGAHVGLYRERWLLEGHAQLLGAVLALQSAGFSRSTAAPGVDAGLEVGARVGWRLGQACAFLQLAGTGWARSHVIEVAGVSEVLTLPRLEASLLLGLSWRSL